MKTKNIIAVVAAGLLVVGSLRAQDLDVIDRTSGVDLSQITDAFVRNMTLLDKALSANMHDEETHQLMLVVISKAGDVARYYRAGGGANLRRQMLDRQEDQKRSTNIRRSDSTKADEIAAKIKAADPDGMFGKARGDYGRSVGELQRYLGLYQTADQTVTDIIRLIQEHLGYFQNAMGKYQ